MEKHVKGRKMEYEKPGLVDIMGKGAAGVDLCDDGSGAVDICDTGAAAGGCSPGSGPVGQLL